MQLVRHECREGVATIALNRPKANALNLELVTEIQEALDQAVGDPTVRAVVLTSYVPRFFSAGFDVAEVFRYGRAEMSRFLGVYWGLTQALANCAKPTVCAIAGHCFAGGTILALACDLRVMAEGDFGVALNEINVGVAVPAHVVKMLVDVVGPGAARRMILTGNPVPAARALSIGLVDDIASADDVWAHAAEAARVLGSKPAAVYAEARRVLRRVLGEGAPAPMSAADLDAWFTPEAEERKRAMIAAICGSAPGGE